MPDFETLVGKALSDEAFAAALVENPKPTLREIGIEPTPEMLEALDGIDQEAVQKLAAAFGAEKAAV